VKKTPITTDFYFGLSGIDLGGRVIELGKGIQLRSTFAHLFGTDILAFERPATPYSYHPGPWQAVSPKAGVDILAELFVPKEYINQKLSNLAIGHTIISLLRLWADPKIHFKCLHMSPSQTLKVKKLRKRVGN
jgi:hypothetical protein